MKEIIKATIKHLKSGQNLVMATVIKHKGSTPREAGARLIIMEDGTSQGTVGGGLVEAKSFEAAKSLFGTKSSLILRFDMAQQSLDPNSMICGGNMTVLLEYLEANETNISFYSAINEIYESRKNAILIVKIDEDESGNCNLTKGITGDEGVVAKGLTCSESILQQIHSTIPESKKPTLLAIEADKYWVEPLLLPKNLILFGAGHVSRTTAQIGVMTGFQVTVVDDRPELMTREFFPEPIELKPIDSLETCCKELAINEDSFLVILTRSHVLDRSLLQQTIRLPFGYLGMIGSQKKRNTIYDSLLDGGVTDEELKMIHSPIGLNIGANTPQEIAVSIIAELIEVRAKVKQGMAL